MSIFVGTKEKPAQCNLELEDLQEGRGPSTE